MYFDIVRVAENATGLNCCIPISSGEQLSIELGNFLKLKFEDLTEEDIAELQQPALDAAEIANTAAENAQTVADTYVNVLSQKADHGYGEGETIKTLKQVESQISNTTSDVIIYGPGRPDKPDTTKVNGVNIITGNEPVGTQYNSSDGANVGAWIWAKRTDGWQVVHGDTNMVVVNPDNLSAGKLVFRRLNSLVTFGIGYQGPFGTYTISTNPVVKDGNKIVLGTVPLGFCSTTIPQFGMVTEDGNLIFTNILVNVLIRSDQGQIQLRFPDAATLNTFKGKNLLRSPIMSWSTNEVWPDQI